MMNGDRMTGPKYWRSLDELAGTPEFKQWVHREFPENATDMLEGESRRTVLKVMAASFGLAGLAACSRPVEHILPNSKGVDNYVPGQSYFYGTAMSLGGHVQGLLVETHDGRPTKIEGNPDHPTSLGAATALAQASILNLYDPDRSRTVLEGGKDSTWAKFEAAAKGLSLGDGSGLRFLSETVMSPSLASLRAAALQKFPKAKWVEYESFNRENERLGCEIATGTPGYSRARYDNAKVIVSLDLDFLNLDIPAPLSTKLFAKRRRVESEEDLEKLTRLYMVESQFSITGSNADHRLRVKGSAIKQFAMDLAAQLGALPGLNVVGNGDRGAKFLAAVVKDLKAAGKEGLVVAGPRQPAVVHAIAHLINSQLGAIGTTVEFPKHVHASTQEHGAMEGRPIVREATVAEYKKNPKTIEERQELPVLDSLYPQRTYDQGYQWGMAIDLTACTGCNACVVACTAENNIPVVGKEQVLRGREMHWLRLDRYYVGSEDEPRAVEQPLPCMQCENAPCENVCPVAATTHSNEGLNDMVYNRCVGTRYCANNCPFKVRHFNFLNFHKHEEEVMKMVYNPDVTVRMRGVMEKCTYCVQRIQETKIKAKVDGRREIKEGEVQTACQQTCPADAIAFGNINDPNSRVAKLKKQERNYALLADLNIRPRTTYLARLRNPNPELEPQNGEREA